MILFFLRPQLFSRSGCCHSLFLKIAMFCFHPDLFIKPIKIEHLLYPSLDLKTDFKIELWLWSQTLVSVLSSYSNFKLGLQLQNLISFYSKVEFQFHNQKKKYQKENCLSTASFDSNQIRHYYDPKKKKYTYYSSKYLLFFSKYLINNKKSIVK